MPALLPPSQFVSYRLHAVHSVQLYAVQGRMYILYTRGTSVVQSMRAVVSHNMRSLTIITISIYHASIQPFILPVYFMHSQLDFNFSIHDHYCCDGARSDEK
jgi:hypothetical protein